MIGSNNNNNGITSLLVLVTSTICEAFQPTPTLRRPPKGPLLWRLQLEGPFQNRDVSQPPPMIPPVRRSTVMTMTTMMTTTPWEVNHRGVTPNHRRRRGRYMIGDYHLLETTNRDGGSGDATFTTTTASPASFRKNSGSTELYYCAAIRPDAEIAMDDNGPTKSATTTTTWKNKLLQFSTLASLLCVMDCTILPILTVILPLLGMVSSVPTMVGHDALHHYGHLMTIYFVLPTGALATTINYWYNHGKKWITAIGWFGLLLILAANSGAGGCGAAAEHLSSHAHHHLATTTSSSITTWDGMIHLLSSIRNTIQHGMYHRITNISGCAFLILSNYLSHRYHQKNHGRTHGKDCCTPLL